jgi:hypothetical protein
MKVKDMENHAIEVMMFNGMRGREGKGRKDN